MMQKIVSLLLVVGLSGSMAWGGQNDLVSWENAMRSRRPHLPARETRSSLTLKAVTAAKNGESATAIRAAAKKALGTLPGSAAFKTMFKTDEEQIEIADFTSGGIHNRLAVYGQLGNFAPYYLIADGLAVNGPSDMAEFLKRNCGINEMSAVFSVEDVLTAAEVEIKDRGEGVAVPYERFYFVFVDDKPGANWAHPCRYVFIAEDCSSFTILYKAWHPRLSVRATQESIPLQPLGETPQADGKSLEEIKASVYNYARGLAAKNSIDYSLGDKSKAYFVLISGGGDKYSNGIRFWCDTAMMYSTLTKKYGVSKDHIYVYMSDGTSSEADANLGSDSSPSFVDSPWDLDGDSSTDITGAATWNNVDSGFSTLRSKLTSSDQLFIFVTSHGGPDGVEGPSNYDCYAWLFDNNSSAYFTDDDLASWTSGFSCPVAFAIETCYSGGFIDDICNSKPNRVVATACNHYESSYGTGHGSSSWTWQKTSAHNTWSAPLIAAFRGYTPGPLAYYTDYPWSDYDTANADSNGDGKVSFAEARIYAYNNDTARCTLSTHSSTCGSDNWTEHPQYRESTSGLGSRFWLIPSEGGGALVFSDSFRDAAANPETCASGSISGSNSGAMSESGEPMASYGATVWFSWTAPVSGTATFSTSGSNFDTVMGIYTGSSLSTLTKVCENDDDPKGGTTSYGVIKVAAGVTYHICIAGWSNSTGTIMLTWNLDVPKLTVWFNLGNHGKRVGGGDMKQTVEYGSYAIEPVVQAYPGYIFKGWNKTLGPLKVHNYTITARYVPANCAVTFNIGSKGRHVGGGDMKQTVPFGGKVSNPPGVKAADGWTFLGWDGNISLITRSVTFTAQYDKPVCTATFVIDGKKGRHVEGGDMKQSLAYGNSPVPPGVKANAGYTFKGWSPAIGGMTRSQTYTAVFK